MSDRFFDRPILNSPYEYPSRHWELDESGQPTSRILDSRRRVSFITPIPKPKKRGQREMDFDEAAQALETDGQQYQLMEVINALRRQVDAWRAIPDPGRWRVTPETARLLQHWRNHRFNDIRPFFCQVEAAEAAIWLTEVAPALGNEGRRFLDHLAAANEQANPGLSRLALKLATGAGKTTVMAMLIAWQTVNAVRRPGSRRFTRGFLVVAPGLTIRDRLRVLQPNDPDSYYQSRELVPADMLGDLDRAKIVITNYHAFMLRESLAISKGGRALLQGRGPDIATRETAGQMLQRVMPDLMGMKNILVLNDEAHHCYREKRSEEDEEGPLTGDDRTEAQKNKEAARVWISGLETVRRKLGIGRVIDLSATPFFLRGSGYAEGTLFPWTVSDFSLMDAIESGIVKLPRVPVADNIPSSEMPTFRNLWHHIGRKMPKKGRGKAASLDPLSIPVELQTALQALTATTPAPSSCGRTPASTSRHASLSCATTPRPQSWSTTSSRASSARTRTARRRWSRAGSRCSGTSTSTAIRWRGHAPCSSTASSSNPGRRSTRTSEPRPAARSSGSAARSSSGPGTAGRRRTSPIRTCCARS